MNDREYAEVDIEPFKFVIRLRMFLQASQKGLPFVAGPLPVFDGIIWAVRMISNDRIQLPQNLDASVEPVVNQLRFHRCAIGVGLFQRILSLR